MYARYGRWKNPENNRELAAFKTLGMQQQQHACTANAHDDEALSVAHLGRQSPQGAARAST